MPEDPWDWDIYLNLVDFYGKCIGRYTIITWILWDSILTLEPQLNQLLKHPKIRCFFLKEVTTKSFMKKFGKKILSLLEVPNKKFKQKIPASSVRDPT